MARVLDGRALAIEHERALSSRIQHESLSPGLGIVCVGENPASSLYVRLKTAMAKRVGIRVELTSLAQSATPQEVTASIDAFNDRSDIHGILLQLPLPAHLASETDNLIARISPTKDADGFHPINRATIADRAKTQQAPAPVLPQAVRALLESTHESLEGKTMALLVRSADILGFGLNEWLAPLGITTIYTGIDYTDQRVVQADIVVCALGKAHVVQPEHIHPGAILIDIGTNLLPDGSTTGDISPACDSFASWRSPVPGGIGPLTVLTLLENVTELADILSEH